MKLSELKAGDEVILSHYDTLSIEKIAKLTPSGIAHVGTMKFRIKGDYARLITTDSYHRILLDVPTDELRERVRRQNLADRVSKIVTRGLSTDQLQRIADILKEGK